MTHYIEKCSCGKVVSQCRCAAPNKEVRVSTKPCTHTKPDRRVVGDTPEHGKHLLWDSHTESVTECNGGLSFTVGVAVLEAELVRDVNRYWQVQHPNGVAIYHVACTDTGQIIVTRIGG